MTMAAGMENSISATAFSVGSRKHSAENMAVRTTTVLRNVVLNGARLANTQLFFDFEKLLCYETRYISMAFNTFTLSIESS